MEQHLLAIHIGPVQDFIAQARRTRDLRAGSQLLCELSRAAATAVRDSGAELIVPPQNRVDDRTADIANRILALTADPKSAVLAARSKLQAMLNEMKRQLNDQPLKDQRTGTCAHIKDVLDKDAQERIEEQLDTLLEFYATSVPVTGREDRAAHKELQAILNARKNLHEFKPWKTTEGRKSSLDGARASVLIPPTQRPPLAVRRPAGPWAKLGISKGEELDAVGLLKRVKGWNDSDGHYRFAPVPTVAAVPWLRRAARENPVALQRLAKECEDKGLTKSRNPLIEEFPYDAQVLLDYRWVHYLGDEAGLLSDDELEQRSEADALAERQKRALQFGKEFVRPLLKQFGRPGEYLACLVADGDDMGTLIEQCKTFEEERDLAERLARFASAAREIVEGHGGMLVYAGGDDVLAFINLEDAVACAAELAASFHQHTQARGTLSIGLGVGHCMEALGDLLEMGRDAEKLAKRSGKNGLAVRLEKRSAGQTREWFAKWSQDPADRLKKDLELLKTKRISKKKIHEILAARERFKLDGKRSKLDDQRRDDQKTAYDRIFVMEAQRILQRSNRGLAAAPLSLTELGLPAPLSARGLEDVCNRLLIVTEILEASESEAAE